jgi:hypothetical protein
MASLNDRDLVEWYKTNRRKMLLGLRSIALEEAKRTTLCPTYVKGMMLSAHLATHAYNLDLRNVRACMPKLKASFQKQLEMIEAMAADETPGVEHRVCVHDSASGRIIEESRVNEGWYERYAKLMMQFLDTFEEIEKTLEEVLRARIRLRLLERGAIPASYDPAKYQKTPPANDKTKMVKGKGV